MVTIKTQKYSIKIGKSMKEAPNRMAAEKLHKRDDTSKSLLATFSSRPYFLLLVRYDYKPS